MVQARRLVEDTDRQCRSIEPKANEGDALAVDGTFVSVAYYGRALPYAHKHPVGCSTPGQSSVSSRLKSTPYINI